MKLKIRFDGPPGPEMPAFIEVEDEDGNGFRAGEWEADPESGDYFLVIETTDFN